MTRAIADLLVVGRDTVAWLAGLSLHRALGKTGVRIRVVELPSLLRDVDVHAALPSLHGLNTLLGLAESEMLSACAGVPVLGQRFSNWSAGLPPFVRGYDTPPTGDRDIDFLHYWLKARAEGLGVAFEDFSLASAAAKQGRLPAADAPAGPLSAAPGYSLDATSYAALLRAAALRAGIERVPGKLAGIERDGDRITAILLDDGSRLAADFYVDASGSEAALIGGQPGAETVSWAQWLPCDRVLAASAAPLSPLPAFSEISAFEHGWLGLFPLRNRTAVIAAWRSGDAPDDAVLQRVADLAGVPLRGDAFVANLSPGMRPRPWIGNVVAVGEAAVTLEPLDAVQLHLAHVGISHLVSLFPVDADRPLEAEPYNRAIVAHAEAVRDFQAAHYRLNGRKDEPFWDDARAARGLETLEERIRIFERRATVPLQEGETFLEQTWAASFVGHGLIPAGYDPRIEKVPRERHMEKVQQRLRHIAAQVRAMPSVDAFLSAGGGR